MTCSDCNVNPAPLTNLAIAAFDASRALIATLLAWRRNRAQIARDTRHLRGMNDRSLDDIGIRRSVIESRVSDLGAERPDLKGL